MGDKPKKTIRKARPATDRGPESQIANRQSSVISLLPYQRRWIEDDSPLKIVVKARQIGYSFAATLRVVFECLKRKTTWILLSKGERQSKLMMEKVREHIQSCGIVAQALECEYFEGTSLKQLETRFPNGSAIYALPANPDTARGYSGNVTLDEFAFHADADKIYAALYPSVTRGYRLEVISTPNGQQGKFYELAKNAGLADGPSGVSCQLPVARAGSKPAPAWSAHACDIYEAVRQGLKIDLQQLRAGCEDDAAWRQEFCCQFVSTAENFFPPELVARCISPEASQDDPQITQISQINSADYFLGIDIGRRHDRTVFWVDEVLECGSVLPLLNPESHLRLAGEHVHMNESGGKPPHSKSVTRLVHALSNVPFDRQLAYARELLSLRGGNGERLIRRAAIDATGMGAPLAESLAQEFGPRVEPVTFTAAVKEDLAYRTKRRMENGLTLLPDSREIRRAFAAVKKFVTVTGNVRFDAERTEAGHSDEFWAKALADYAAELQPAAHHSDGFLADARPIISPAAFAGFGIPGADLRF